MIVEALASLLESVTAFWVGLASGGFFKAIMIWCIIYWIFCRRRRWGRHRWGWGCRSRGCGCGWHGCDCGCAHCDCVCGGCACGAEPTGADRADPADADAGTASEG